MTTEMLKNALLNFGLNKTDASVYLALYQAPSLNIQHIVDLTGLPRKRVMSALSHLLSLELIKEGKSEKGRIFSCRTPYMLTNLAEQEYKNKIELSKQLSQILLKQYDKIRQNGPLDKIQVFQTGRYAWETFLELFDKTEEVLSFGKPPFTMATDKQLQAFLSENSDAIVKVIYEIGVESVQKLVERARKVGGEKLLIELSEIVRFVPTVHQKGMVINRRFIFYIIGDENPIFLCVDDEAMGHAFAEYFELVWAGGKKWNEVVTD